VVRRLAASWVGMPRPWTIRLSWLKNLVVGAYANETRAHARHFWIPSFRVLTMTTRPDRKHQMIDTYRRHIEPLKLAGKPGLFLFGYRETLAAHNNDPLAMPWLSGTGKETYLDGR